MSKYRLQKLIGFLMHALLAVNACILIDYYVLPVQLKEMNIISKYYSPYEGMYLLDNQNKKHKVSDELYHACQNSDKLFITETRLFNHLKSIIVQSSVASVLYDFSSLFLTLIIILVLYLLWYILKGKNDYLYFLFFTPYLVMNIFFWIYLIGYKL